MTIEVQGRCTESGLTQIGHNYIAFLDRAGKAETQDFAQDVPKLFASVCKKIVNGKTMFDKSDAFGPYLGKAQEVFGKWEINQEYHLYPSPSTRSITISFIAETVDMQLLVIAILQIDKEGLICEIFEVDTMR